jgi:5-(aminomethyl)-3-furanmethanol phosphate kinase
MERRLCVVKVGGSLLDLPDLKERLQSWLATVPPEEIVVLVPGGGPTTDVIRVLDRRFQLGEERAHWLALRGLTLNAHILASLLPGARIIAQRIDLFVPGSRLCLLDSHAFAGVDEHGMNGDPLPHSWDATSDSLAARLALAWGAARLILLKSVTIPATLTWEEAGRSGLVDPLFPGIVGAAVSRLEVSAFNLRTGERGLFTPSPGE